MYPRNENGDINRLLVKRSPLFILRMKAKCSHWKQPFLISRKLARHNVMKYGRIWKTKTTNKAKCRKTVHKSKNAELIARFNIELVKRHQEPPVLLYFSGFPGWPAWFSLQIFCLNNKIHFSLGNVDNRASLKRKMVKKSRFLLIHKQQINLRMKLPKISPRLAGKIVKYRPLSDPIRLQDLEDSACSQAYDITFSCGTN